MLLHAADAAAAAPGPACPCRHDRRKRILLHPLSFQGTCQPVVWLEVELRQRGLLPGRNDPEHGMLHAPVSGGVRRGREAGWRGIGV